MALKAHVLAIAGQKEQAKDVIRRWRRVQERILLPYEIGHVYVSLGDHDTAVDWFRKGLADSMGHMFHFAPGPNRYGPIAFYELHVWAWKNNPRGAFADWNPNVSCSNWED